MRSTKSSSRFAALALAMALVGASCGGGAAETAATVGSADDNAANGDAANGDAANGDAANGDAANGDSTESDPAEDEAAEEEVAEAGSNVFPDIDVSNVSDGSTVNLAVELGGGDTPVLLWFWAPH